MRFIQKFKVGIQRDYSKQILNHVCKLKHVESFLGFYKTLKQKAEKILYSKTVGGPGPTFRTYFLQDSLAFSFIGLMIIAALKNSWPIAMAAGLVLGMNTSCAHNFFHQSNTWRRFYWDMSMVKKDSLSFHRCLCVYLHAIDLSFVFPEI